MGNGKKKRNAQEEGNERVIEREREREAQNVR